LTRDADLTVFTGIGDEASYVVHECVNNDARRRQWYGA
jgi:hypothetical protein